MSLINCEINLILTWFENCVFTSKATRTENYANAANLVDKIILFVPVVTFLTENDKKFLEQLRAGFKRTIW